MHILTKDKNWS